MFSLDLYLFNFIHQFAGRYWPLDWLGVFLAEYLPYVLVIAVVYFWLRRKTSKEKIFFFSFVVLSVILSRGIITEVIRYFYNRPRPFEALNFDPLIARDVASSFPSGHAAFFFALAFCLFYFNKKWSLWFMALSLLMGVARVFVGVHYLLDILGGIVIAVVSVLVVSKILDMKKERV